MKKKRNTYKNNTDGTTWLIDHSGRFRWLVDTDQVESLKQLSWSASDTGYARAYLSRDPETGKQKNVYLHEYLIGTREGFVVDHIDRDPTNNLLSNLRHLPRAINAINTEDTSRASKSGLKNIFQNAMGSWVVRIGRKRYGTWDDLADAQIARLYYRNELYGRWLPELAAELEALGPDVVRAALRRKRRRGPRKGIKAIKASREAVKRSLNQAIAKLEAQLSDSGFESWDFAKGGPEDSQG